MRYFRALLILLLAASVIVLLVHQQRDKTDLAAVMKRHGLKAGVIAYGPPGKNPRILTINAPQDQVFHYWSLSKPITAAAVFAGVDKGLVRLDERYAGASVADLLRHAGGWDREVAGDPAHRPGRPARCIDIPAPARQFAPGSREAYSNIGYCLLGRMIEERFGKPYEKVVAELVPGTAGMRYDSWLGPAGGWSGTAAQYFAFARHEVDPDALERPVYARKGPYYAMGWRVLPDGTLSHYGVLTGTAADQYTVVFKRPGWVAVGLFSGMPRDWEAARADLLEALAVLPAG